MDERVERIAEDRLGLDGERFEVRRERHRRALGEPRRALGDVAREVADALEIRGDVVGGQQPAQVVGDRSLEREAAQHGLVDRDVETVDLEVVFANLEGEFGVALEERAQRLGEDRLAAAPHAQDQLVHFTEEGLDGAGHCGTFFIMAGREYREGSVFGSSRTPPSRNRHRCFAAASSRNPRFSPA